jgi:hypothetical protein
VGSSTPEEGGQMQTIEAEKLLLAALDDARELGQECEDVSLAAKLVLARIAALRDLVQPRTR